MRTQCARGSAPARRARLVTEMPVPCPEGCVRSSAWSSMRDPGRPRLSRLRPDSPVLLLVRHETDCKPGPSPRTTRAPVLLPVISSVTSLPGTGSPPFPSQRSRFGAAPARRCPEPGSPDFASGGLAGSVSRPTRRDSELRRPATRAQRRQQRRVGSAGRAASRTAARRSPADGLRRAAGPHPGPHMPVRARVSCSALTRRPSGPAGT